MKLRPYQETAKQRIRESIQRGNKNILVVSPTGSGKTVLFSSIASDAAAKRKYVLAVAHRREIIHQTSDKLNAYDCGHGILMAGHNRSILTHVQVASIQTFNARVVNGKQEAPAANLLIFDEAHHSISATFTRLREMYPGAILLGFTATPCRGDGRGLGDMYDDLIEVTTIADLVDLGYLAEPEIYAPSIPDLGGVRIQRGDYVEKDLEEVMDTQELVGNVVRDWETRAKDRQTIVFAASVAHSRHLCHQFEAAGYKAAHIDGHTDNEVRDEILRQFENKEIQVICNCMVLTEGYDAPIASCCILARPTKSLSLFLQMVGRVLRPHEECDGAVIIDHAGAVYEHGFPEDAGDWDLDPDQPIQERRAEKLAKEERQPATCRNCFHTYKGQPECPKCGWMATPREVEVNMKEGRLHKLEKRRKKKSSLTPEERHWNSCLFRCANAKGNRTMKQVMGMFNQKYRGTSIDGFLRVPRETSDWQLTAREFVNRTREVA